MYVCLSAYVHTMNVYKCTQLHKHTYGNSGMCACEQKSLPSTFRAKTKDYKLYWNQIKLVLFICVHIIYTRSWRIFKANFLKLFIFRNNKFLNCKKVYKWQKKKNFWKFSNSKISHFYQQKLKIFIFRNWRNLKKKKIYICVNIINGKIIWNHFFF